MFDYSLEIDSNVLTNEIIFCQNMIDTAEVEVNKLDVALSTLNKRIELLAALDRNIVNQHLKANLDLLISQRGELMTQRNDYQNTINDYQEILNALHALS